MLERLEIKDWLELNAKLQQKKNAVRKVLKERGVLQRGSVNKYDNYKYFSEAQYKELFTELFSSHGLELKSSAQGYDQFDGTEKQQFGRMVRVAFDLIDTDTGFFERSEITGEGMDKGDKAGYKAYTGALKYYLANTFMVATGDDPEKESQDGAKRKSPELICEKCGKVIKDGKLKNGVRLPAEQIARLTKERWGQQLCEDCGKAMKEAASGGAYDAAYD